MPTEVCLYEATSGCFWGSINVSHQSGFYIWLKNPLSNKAKEDRCLAGLLKQAWLESGCVYGYRKLHADLRSIGEVCSTPTRLHASLVK